MARTRSDEPKLLEQDERLRLTYNADRSIVTVEWRVYRYRFLFANADVLEVVSTGDDSHLRGALLKLRGLGEDRIVGVSDGEPVGWTSNNLG